MAALDTHNISKKLSLSAAWVLRSVSAIAEDSDTSLDLETMTYIQHQVLVSRPRRYHGNIFLREPTLSEK